MLETIGQLGGYSVLIDTEKNVGILEFVKPLQITAIDACCAFYLSTFSFVDPRYEMLLKEEPFYYPEWDLQDANQLFHFACSEQHLVPLKPPYPSHALSNWLKLSIGEAVQKQYHYLRTNEKTLPVIGNIRKI